MYVAPPSHTNSPKSHAFPLPQNNPLHVSLFPPDARAPLEFSFLLSSSLDIFEARMPHKTADQDFGLLQAVDERLAMYGWMTNTGVKFVVVVDMEGRPATQNDAKATSAIGLRDADMKPVSRQINAHALRASCRIDRFPGFQSVAVCLHWPAAQPLLRPGPALSSDRQRGAVRRLDADHEPPLHQGSEEDRRGLDPRYRQHVALVDRGEGIQM